MTCHSLPLPLRRGPLFLRLHVSSQQQPRAQTFRNTTPSLASIPRRHRGGAGALAGQDGAGEEGASPRRGTRTTGHGLRVQGRDRGTGRREAHLQDTVISTLVAGMLPAKESNSLSDVMSSGCSIAHGPPHPLRPKLVSPCALRASREQLKPRALPNYGAGAGAGAEAGGKGGEERSAKRGRGK